MASNMVLKGRQVSSLQDRVDILKEQVWSKAGGLRDPTMRRIGLMVTQHCPPRDDLCELQAIFDFVAKNVRYTGDITYKDTFQSGLRTLQMGGGDCFPMRQKIVCRSKSSGQYELVRLGDLRLAHSAYDALSYNFGKLRYEFQPILAFQDKGERDVLKARLTNGTDLVATADHKFWALDGQTPRVFKQNLEVRTLGEYAALRRDKNRNFRMAHTRILQAAHIPLLNVVEAPKELAYLSGIYAAEGYDDGKHLCISQYKPEIRAKIEAALNFYGVSYRFQLPHGRTEGSGAYYALRTSAVKDALRTQGSNSFNMQIPMSLLSGNREMAETLVDAYGDGDAYHPKPESRWFKKVDAIHATSSDELAEQLCFGMLLLGRPFNKWHQMRHGGVGKRPIWRLHEYCAPRLKAREEKIRDVLPGLRYGFVQSVVPAGREPVGCITVDATHNFVLSDGTIASNCDDHSVGVVTLAMENGFQARFRITSNTGATWDHIYPMCGYPKHTPRNWIALDTTLGAGKFGREPGRAKFRDFTIGED